MKIIDMFLKVMYDTFSTLYAPHFPIYILRSVFPVNKEIITISFKGTLSWW